MDYKSIAFWLMIVSIFILGIYLVYYIQTESFECLSNPYSYPLKLLEEANNAPVTCLCSVNDPDNPARAVLTNEGFKPFVEEKVSTSFNFSYNITFAD